jgi:hypothetical protein
MDSKPRRWVLGSSLPVLINCSHPRDGIERRAQFVRDRPEEFVLHPARRFGLGLGHVGQPRVPFRRATGAPQLRDEPGQEQSLSDEERQVRLDGRDAGRLRDQRAEHGPKQGDRTTRCRCPRTRHCRARRCSRAGRGPPHR